MCVCVCVCARARVCACKLESRLPKQTNHIAISTRTKLEITLGKLKRSLAFDQNKQIQPSSKVLPKNGAKIYKNPKKNLKTHTFENKRTHFEKGFAYMKKKIFRS